MKAIVIAAFVALAFTTGFTCSKNQPADQAPPPQEEMAAPETMTPPADGEAPADEAAPADGTEGTTEGTETEGGM